MRISKPKFKHFLNRLAAVFLTISLLFSSTVQAAPIVSNKTENKPSVFQTSIPKNFGKVEESFAGTSGKTIYYIQDAHDSLEAQKHIAGLIRHFVKREGVRTVFEEGYEGPVPTGDYFGFIKNPKIREKVSYFLMDKLRLGGAEYAHVNRPHLNPLPEGEGKVRGNFKLIGADSLALHRDNIRWYQKNSRSQQATSQDLTVLQSEIEKIAQKHLPKKLKDWIKLKKKFDRQELGLLDYLQRTKNLGIPFDDYPHITLILSAKGGQDPIMARKLAAMDAKELFAEIESLEARIGRLLGGEGLSLRVVEYFRMLELYQRLNQISLTPAEYQVVKNLIKNFDTGKIAQFIVTQTKKSSVFSALWETQIQNAFRFYETAHARDEKIEESLRAFMQNPDEKKAVLVFGGFHKEAIKQILTRQNFSWAVITPKISQLDSRHSGYYKQLMSVGHHAFEKPFILNKAARAESILQIQGHSEIKALYEAARRLESPLFLSREFLVSAMEREVTQKKQPSRSETRTLKIRIQTLLTTFEREIQWEPLESFQHEALLEDVNNLSMHIPVNPDQIHGFIQKVVLVENTFPLSTEIKAKFRAFRENLERIEQEFSGSEPASLDEVEEEFVQETRRDVFGPLYEAGENAILEKKIYTEESLSRKQAKAWGEASIRERVAGADGKPSVFYSLSAGIYPQGPEAGIISRHWQNIQDDFKSQPFAEKFYVPPFEAFNLTLRWLALSSKTPYPQEKIEEAEIVIKNLTNKLQPFDIWIQGLSIDPETGRIFAEAVFLDEKNPKPRFIPLFTPFQPLSPKEINWLISWIEENRDFIFGRVRVEKVSLVHSLNVFAGDNILKKEYPLGVNRSEVRQEEAFDFYDDKGVLRDRSEAVIGWLLSGDVKGIVSVLKAASRSKLRHFLLLEILSRFVIDHQGEGAYQILAGLVNRNIPQENVRFANGIYLFLQELLKNKSSWAEYGHDGHFFHLDKSVYFSEYQADESSSLTHAQRNALTRQLLSPKYDESDLLIRTLRQMPGKAQLSYQDLSKTVSVVRVQAGGFQDIYLVIARLKTGEIVPFALLASRNQEGFSVVQMEFKNMRRHRGDAQAAQVLELGIHPIGNKRFAGYTAEFLDGFEEIVYSAPEYPLVRGEVVGGFTKNSDLPHRAGPVIEPASLRKIIAAFVQALVHFYDPQTKIGIGFFASTGGDLNFRDEEFSLSPDGYTYRIKHEIQRPATKLIAFRQQEIMDIPYFLQDLFRFRFLVHGQVIALDKTAFQQGVMEGLLWGLEGKTENSQAAAQMAADWLKQYLQKIDVPGNGAALFDRQFLEQEIARFESMARSEVREKAEEVLQKALTQIEFAELKEENPEAAALLKDVQAFFANPDLKVIPTKNKNFHYNSKQKPIVLEVPDVRLNDTKTAIPTLLHFAVSIVLKDKKLAEEVLRQTYQNLRNKIKWKSSAELAEAIAEKELSQGGITDEELKRAAQEGRRMADAEIAAKRDAGPEIDSGLFRGILPYAENLRDSWQGFSAAMTVALNSRDSEQVARLLEKIVNVFYQVLQYRRITLDGTKFEQNLRQAMLDYFNHPFGQSGNSEKLFLLLEAAGEIEEKNLLPALQGKILWTNNDPKEPGFKEKIAKAEISTRRAEEMRDQMAKVSSSAPLAIGFASQKAAAVAGFLTAGPSGASASAPRLALAGPQVEERRDKGKEDPTEIQVDFEFLENRAYTFGEFLIGSLGSSLTAEKIGQANSLEEILPLPLFRNLHTAYQRDVYKKTNPESRARDPYFDSKEVRDWLKYLYVLSTTYLKEPLEELNAQAKGLGVPLPVFFMGQTLHAYFNKHLMEQGFSEEIREQAKEAYLAELRDLGNKYNVFYETLAYLAQLQPEKKKKKKKAADADGEEEKDLNWVKAQRQKVFMEVQKSGGSGAPGRLKGGKSREKSLDGFVDRWAAYLIDEDLEILLDQDQTEVRRELLYLIGGVHVFVTKAFDAEGELVQIRNDEINGDYHKAVVQMLKALHPDRIASVPLLNDPIGPDGQSFADYIRNFIESVQEFPGTYQGWQTDYFAEKFKEVQEVVRAYAEDRDALASKAAAEEATKKEKMKLVDLHLIETLRTEIKQLTEKLVGFEEIFRHLLVLMAKHGPAGIPVDEIKNLISGLHLPTKEAPAKPAPLSSSGEFTIVKNEFQRIWDSLQRKMRTLGEAEQRLSQLQTEKEYAQAYAMSIGPGTPKEQDFLSTQTRYKALKERVHKIPEEVRTAQQAKNRDSLQKIKSEVTALEQEAGRIQALQSEYTQIFNDMITVIKAQSPRSELRTVERTQRELWALDYVELSKNQTPLAKLVIELKELEEKIRGLGMPDKRVAVIYPLVFSVNAILKTNPDFATPFAETKIKDILARQIPAVKQAIKIEFVYETSKKRVEAHFSYPDKAILLNYIVMGPQVNMYADESQENDDKVLARFHALLDGKIPGTLDYFQPGVAEIVDQVTGQPLHIPALDIEAAAPLLDFYIVFDWMTRSKTTDDEARRGTRFLNSLLGLYPGILADFYLPQFIESLEGTRFFYKEGEIHLYSDAGAEDAQIQNWLKEMKTSGKVTDIPPSKMADLVSALPVDQFVRDQISPIEMVAAPDVYAMAFHSLHDSPAVAFKIRYDQIKATLEAALKLTEAALKNKERIGIEIKRSEDQKTGEVITRYAEPFNRELMLEWLVKSGSGDSGVTAFSIEDEKDKGWYRVRKYFKDPHAFLHGRSEVRTAADPKLWLNPNPPAGMQKPESGIHQKVLKDYEDLLKNVKKTPLLPLDRISELTGKKVFLKNDAQQYGGSFKIRGVYWEVYSAIRTLLKRPDAKQILRDGFKIVTQSTGNHGIAMIKSLELILAKLHAKYEKSDPELAQLLFNIEPLIFTLKEIPEPKYPAMQLALRDYRKLAGENRGEIKNLYDTYESALEARKIFVGQQEDRAVYIRHASAETTFGYGSAGIEIAEQLKAAGISEKQKVVLIFPVGAGGPIGFATGLRLARFENTYAVMAQSDRWDAFVRSLKTGRLEKNEQPIEPTDVIKNADGTETAVWFTDGSAVDAPEEFAIDLAKGHLDAAVAVDERAAYDFSGPLLLADLRDHMGDLARVGGTTALTAETLLTQNENIPVIQDADVVVLFGTEGSVSPYVHKHLEDQLPEINAIKTRYQKRSEVRHAPVFSADAEINQKIFEEIENNFVRKSEIPALNLLHMLADYDGPQLIGVPSSVAGKDIQQIMRERGIESVETLKHYLLGSEDTVLDIGSGSKGGFAFILAMLGADVTSVEMAPWAIDALKKKYAELAPFIQKAGGKWKLIEGDFSNPELRKDLQGGFQHIIASDVIVPLRPGEKDRLAPETRPTTDPEKIVSIIDGIAEVKSTLPGIVLLSVPKGSVREAKPYERKILNVVPDKTGLNPLSQKRVSVPFSLGIKSGLVTLFTGFGRRSEVRSNNFIRTAAAWRKKVSGQGRLEGAAESQNIPELKSEQEWLEYMELMLPDSENKILTPSLDKNDLPFPGKKVIAVVMDDSHYGELEVFNQGHDAAFKSWKQQANFVLVFPFPRNLYADLHQQDTPVYLQLGAFKDKKGNWIYGKFEHPLEVDAVHFPYPSDDMWKALEPFRQKTRQKKFFTEKNIPTAAYEELLASPELSSLEDRMSQLQNFALKYGGEVVIKPSDGNQGNGIRFFDFGKTGAFNQELLKEAGEYSLNFNRSNRAALVEKRIKSPAYMKDGVRQDWNIRYVPVRGKDGRWKTDAESLSYVRYSPYINNAPVNVHLGAQRADTGEVFAQVFGDKKDEMFAKMDAAVQALLDAHDEDVLENISLFALDIIFDEDGSVYVMEENFGRVSGVGVLTERFKKNQAAAHLADFLREQASLPSISGDLNKEFYYFHSFESEVSKNNVALAFSRRALRDPKVPRSIEDRIQDMSRAVKMVPSNYLYRLFLADFLTTAGRYDEVITVIDAMPLDGDVYLRSGYYDRLAFHYMFELNELEDSRDADKKVDEIKKLRSLVLELLSKAQADNSTALARLKSRTATGFNEDSLMRKIEKRIEFLEPFAEVDAYFPENGIEVKERSQAWEKLVQLAGQFFTLEAKKHMAFSGLDPSAQKSLFLMLQRIPSAFLDIYYYAGAVKGFHPRQVELIRQSVLDIKVYDRAFSDSENLGDWIDDNVGNYDKAVAAAADVLDLLRKEGKLEAVRQAIKPYLENVLRIFEEIDPLFPELTLSLEPRSEIHSFEDYEKAVALLVDKKEEVYKGLKLAARLDDSTKTPQNRLIVFRKLMDRQAHVPGKMIGKAEVLNSLFKSYDNSHFMKGDPTHDSRPDYSILNKVVEEMSANHVDFPATTELAERTARITYEYFMYQNISLLAFRAYEDWRGASTESGKDALARSRMAAVQKMLENFSATSFQKFDTDPLLSLQFLSSYLSFYEAEYYKLDKFIEVLGPEALARWDEYTLRLIGRHLRGVFYNSDRLWEHRWINVADFALLIRSLNRELARYQAAKKSGDEPAIKRHVQNLLEGLSPDAAFLTTKEEMESLTRGRDPVVVSYDEGTRIYPTDDPTVWKSYWNLLEVSKQPLREDMIKYAEPAEFGYSALGRMDLYWAALAKYMILASILKPGNERLGFRDLLESDAPRPAVFKDASEKLRWNWWIDYRGKHHIADSLDALRYYKQERVNVYLFSVVAALRSRSEMRNQKTLNDWRNEQGIQILRGGKDGLGSSDDEQISLTDDKGVRNGKSASKTEAHEQGLWHETAHGYFFYKGKIVLQVRSQKKKSSPGKFQVSISGHLNIEDKTVVDGLRREGQEESGILLNQKKIHQISGENEIRRSYQSAEGMNNEFTTVFDYALDENELEMIRQGYNLNEIDEFWIIPLPLFERMIAESPYLFSSSLINLMNESRPMYEKMKARALKDLEPAADARIPAENPGRNPFEVMNLEILRMFNQLQSMVIDPTTPLSASLLANELKLIPYSKKLGRADGKHLSKEELAALISELERQKTVLTDIRNNPAYQMDLKPGYSGLFDAHMQYLTGQIDVLTAILSPATGTLTEKPAPRSEVRPNAVALGQQKLSGTGRSEVREKQNPPAALSDLIGGKMNRVVDYATGLGDWPRELRDSSRKWLAVNSEMIPVDLDNPVEYPQYQKRGGFGSVKEYQQANLRGLEIITPSTWDEFLEPDATGKIKEIDLLHVAFLHNPVATLNDLARFETNVRTGGWVLIAHTNKLYNQDEMIKWLKGRGYEDGHIFVYDRESGFPVDYPTTYWWGQYVRLRQNYIIVAQKTRNLFRSEVRENSKTVEVRQIEKMSIPAGVFLDAKELALMPAEELDKQLDEILALLSRHKAFDVYIDGSDRFSVQQFKNPKIQKLLAEHSSQIHLGMHDRANLAKKQILIHASFLEGAGSREETQNMIDALREKYGVKVPVSALEYRQAGSLKAFLDLAERFKPGELIRDIGEAFAVLGPNGRWRVAQDFVATIWNQVQASYRIQWSA